MSRRLPASCVRLNPDAVWERLNRLNVSQNELARRVGITSGYLSQLMTGTRRPAPATRCRLQLELQAENFDDIFIMEQRHEG